MLDLATMKETPLAEKRPLDDQVEWLDDERVLYGIRPDTWVVPADGGGAPRKFLSRPSRPPSSAASARITNRWGPRSPMRRERDPLAVRGPRRIGRRDKRSRGEAHGLAATGVDEPDRLAKALLQDEGDLLTVRRPGGTLATESRVGQPPALRSIDFHTEDRPVTVRCCSAKASLDPSGDQVGLICWSASRVSRRTPPPVASPRRGPSWEPTPASETRSSSRLATTRGHRRPRWSPSSDAGSRFADQEVNAGSDLATAIRRPSGAQLGWKRSLARVGTLPARPVGVHE